MIIAVTDRTISATRDFLEHVEKIVKAEPDMLILREKDLSDHNYRYLAVECARMCGDQRVKFCVNTFTKTAEALKLEDIQISFATLRSMTEMPFKNIWVSVHSLEEAVKAEELGATHLIYGNVFETSCKPGAEGKGLDALRDVCISVDIPVFGIGGIDTDNAREVMDAGCRGVCVRSLLMRSHDPAAVMDQLKKLA